MALPIEEWADEHAAEYRSGFIAAAYNRRYSPFSASPFTQGYTAAISIFWRPEDHDAREMALAFPHVLPEGGFRERALRAAQVPA